MQGKITLVMLGLLTIVLCQTRLDFNSAACNNYLKKFGTANAANGVGPTSLAYTGDAAFANGTSNVVVNLRYSDSLYNDATYWGLTQEDGKAANATCLDLKLWKFTNSSYADPIQVTDLPFSSNSSLQKKWRYLSFTINGNDLATRLQVSQNSNQYVYTGYYAVAYYAAGTTQVQYTYYFQFSVTVSRSSGAAVSTVFKPLSQFETASCSLGQTCSVAASTQLKWCTDVTCTVNTVPDIYLNDQFYLQQVVNTTGLSSYYLTGTVVTYTGNGLNKVTTPVSINNTKAGQVTLLLTADIAWSSLTIQVTSYLSTTQNGTRLLTQVSDQLRVARHLQTDNTTTYDPVSGSTQALTCVKMTKDAATCPTCAEECAQNGFSREGCDTCNQTGKINESYGELVLPFVAIITAFMI